MSAPAPTTSARGVWIYFEHERGQPHRVSLELLSRGRELANELGERLTVAALGPGADEAGREGLRHGADEALAVEHPHLEKYGCLPYTRAVELLCKERNPNILLFGATPNGRDLAARLAVRLKTGLTANAVQLEVEKEKRLLIAAVPGFGGSVLALIKNDRALPQISTVRAGVFAPAEPKSNHVGRVERVELALNDVPIQGGVLSGWKTQEDSPAGAERVIVAGLGTGGNLDAVKRLAALIGARIGVTRPLVDMGVATRACQIGSTGLALRGRIAIVAGASGASHFTSGLRDVDFVIAINKDEHAEIFDHADLCIVGDLNEILPALEEALTQARMVIA